MANDLNCQIFYPPFDANAFSSGFQQTAVILLNGLMSSTYRLG